MQQQNYYNNNQYQQPRRRGFIAKVFPWLLIALVIALLLVFGLQAMRDRRVAQEVAPYETVFADNVSIDGINLSGMSPQQAYDAVYGKRQQSVGSWSLELSYEGHTYVTVNYQTLGLGIDEEAINRSLKEAWDLTHTGDAYQKQEALEQLKVQPYQASTVQNDEFSSNQLEQYLNSIAAYIGNMSEPMDAKLLSFNPDLPDPFVIQAEQMGYQLDVEKAKEEILEYAAQGTSGQYELQPKVIPPSVTEAMLRENMQLRSVAQTEISSRSEPDRTENIRISSGKISGTILKPGAEFSFNKVALERTLKNGYRPALEMVYGYYDTGVGGGVCQTSSTLYQAALQANLQITNRREHGEPVNYTDPGLDATVYMIKGYEIDFKFKNNTAHDIYISTRVKTGASSRSLIHEVKIYGESIGEGVQYKLKTVKAETLLPPLEPRYVDDKEGLYVYYKSDEPVEKDKGKEGSVIETYLQKYVNGILAEENLVETTTYKARQQVMWRGTRSQ